MLPIHAKDVLMSKMAFSMLSYTPWWSRKAKFIKKNHLHKESHACSMWTHMAPWSSFSCRACTPCSAVPPTCTPVPGKLIVSNITVVNMGQCRVQESEYSTPKADQHWRHIHTHMWMDGGMSVTLNNQGNFNGSMTHHFPMLSCFPSLPELWSLIHYHPH